MWPFGKRGKERNPSAEAAETILHDLELLARIEGEIARFYYLCSETFPEDRSFWQEMAASERTHVQYIQRMQDLVRKSPHLFRPDHQFQPASIRLFELSIRNLPDRTRLEKISREELLSLVVEVENSAVEMNYGRIGTTGDEEFNRLTEEIDAETAAHRQSLSAMLARMEA